MQITFCDSIEKITAGDWNRLNTSLCPLTSYEFFKTLEVSQSVSCVRGWQPHHMVIESDNMIAGIMPLYLKQHSWGEYVFDWDWAKAFEDNNIAYYPKLVATIPFTPLSSSKLFSNKFSLLEVFPSLINHCQQNEINSWHVLFCPEVDESSQLKGVNKSSEANKLPEDVYQRHTVQFHWFNRGYANFDEFLATFTSRKRKNTRKERASIKQQDINIRRLQGKNITPRDIDFFYLTYQLTYLKKGHQPHLNADFFQNIFSNLQENTLLIIASHNNEDVACALFFYDDKQLYGRYWGCRESFKNLHFELCYYQGIAFCIENNLQCFNPGTQGEHKIQRGFEPILTNSYHWIKHLAFKDAVKNFCLLEREHMQKYQLECQQALPFKAV